MAFKDDMCFNSNFQSQRRLGGQASKVAKSAEVEKEVLPVSVPPLSSHIGLMRPLKEVRTMCQRRQRFHGV